MNERISAQSIAERLATGKITKKQAEAFVRAFGETIVEGLAADGMVKVRGLGTFKVKEVSARESVSVTTGERIVIPSYKKLDFTPEDQLTERITTVFTSAATDDGDASVLATPEEFAAIDKVIGTAEDASAALPESAAAAEEVVAAVEETAVAVEEVAPAVEETAAAVEEVVAASEEVVEEVAPAVEETVAATEEPVAETEEVVSEEKVETAVEETVAEEEPAVEEVVSAVEETVAATAEEVTETVEETPAETVATAALADLPEAKEETAPATEPVAPVEEPAKEVEKTAETHTATEVSTNTKTEEKTTEEKGHRSVWPWVAVGVVALAVLCFLLFGRGKGNDTPQGPVTQPVDTMPKVVETAPKTFEYELQKGEYLTQLSVRFYHTKDSVSAILRLNNFKNPDNIPPGTVIVMPDTTGASRN